MWRHVGERLQKKKLMLVQKIVFVRTFEVIKRFVSTFSWSIVPNFYSLLIYFQRILEFTLCFINNEPSPKNLHFVFPRSGFDCLDLPFNKRVVEHEQCSVLCNASHA